MTDFTGYLGQFGRVAAPGWADGAVAPLVLDAVRGLAGTAWRWSPILLVLYPEQLGDGELTAAYRSRAVDEFQYEYDWGRDLSWTMTNRPFTDTGVLRYGQGYIADPAPIISDGRWAVTRTPWGPALGRPRDMDDLPQIDSAVSVTAPRALSPAEQRARYDPYANLQRLNQAEYQRRQASIAKQVEDLNATYFAQAAKQQADFADKMARLDAASRAANLSSLERAMIAGEARLLAEANAKANAAALAAIQARQAELQLQIEQDVVGQIPDVLPDVTPLARVTAGRIQGAWALATEFNLAQARRMRERDVARDRRNAQRVTNPGGGSDSKTKSSGYLRALGIINNTYGAVDEMAQVGVAFMQALYIQHEDGSRSYLYGAAYRARSADDGHMQNAGEYLASGFTDNGGYHSRVGERFRTFTEAVKGYMEGEVHLDLGAFATSLAVNHVEDWAIGRLSSGAGKVARRAGSLIGFQAGWAM